MALRTKSLTELALYLMAIGSAVMYFYPYGTRDYAFAPWYDTIDLTGPLFCDLSRHLRIGALPVFNWSTYEATFYNTHIAAYYPFYLLTVLDFCSPRSTANAQDIIALLHLGILFLNSWFLSNTVGLRGGNTVAAAFFATVSANMVMVAVFPTFVASLAWIPLAVAGLLRIVSGYRLVVGTLCFATGSAAMLTAGPGTNMVAPLAWLTYVFVLCGTIRLFRLGRLGYLAKASLCGMGALAAIALLSLASTINLLHHLPEIVRWSRTGAVIGNFAPAESTEILAERLSLARLVLLFLPLPVQLAAGSFYLGPVVIVLAGVGAWVERHNQLARAFVMVIGSILLVVFVIPDRILLMWYHVPGLGHVRHLSLLGTPLAIAAGVLAGFGFKALRNNLGSTSLLAACLMLAVAIASAASAVLNPQIPAISKNVIGSTIAVVLAFGLLVLLRHSVWRLLPLALLFPLQAWCVTGAQGFAIPIEPYEDQRAPGRMAINAALDRVAAHDAEPGRLIFDPSIDLSGFDYLRAGSLATYRGMATFHFYMSPRIAWKFLAENYLFPHYETYAKLGGKYLIAQGVITNPALEQVFQSHDIRVYRVTGGRPLVSLACSTAIAAVQDMAGAPTEPGRQRSTTPAATTLVTDLLRGETNCGPNATLTRNFGRDEVVWSTDSGQNRVVIINLPPYAAWEFTFAGRKISLYNLAERQLVAFLPDDTSGTATLRFEPTDYRRWVTITFIGWALLGAAWLAVFATTLWRSRLPATTTR